MQDHAISYEERSRGSVVELTTIIAQDNFDGMTKLCGDIGEKIDKVGKCHTPKFQNLECD
jgi:hypothetical protein